MTVLRGVPALGLVATAGYAAAATDSFGVYVQRFGKSYGAEEYARRVEIYRQRAAAVEAHNQLDGSLWRAGINHLTDLSPEELRRQFGYNKAMSSVGTATGAALHSLQLAAMGPLMETAGGNHANETDETDEADETDETDETNETTTVPQKEAAELPEAFDWRDHSHPVVTPVKSQGSCGSCWAFAAVETMESHLAIATGTLVSLSPQPLTSCTPNPEHCGGGGGCGGATVQLGFDYAKEHGVSTIWTAPYLSGMTHQSMNCTAGSNIAPEVSIQGYITLPRNEARPLLEAVATIGPVAVTVDATNWWMYYSGIFDSCDKANVDVNHAVQIVGYGHEDDVKYYTVRNSWGVFWGEEGYIRIRRHDAEPCGWDYSPQMGTTCDGGPNKTWACGECGILWDAAYPVGTFAYMQQWRNSRRLRGTSAQPPPIFQ